MKHCNWLKTLYPINPETGRSGNLWFFNPLVDEFVDYVEIRCGDCGYLMRSRETGIFSLLRLNGVRRNLEGEGCTAYYNSVRK